MVWSAPGSWKPWDGLKNVLETLATQPVLSAFSGWAENQTDTLAGRVRGWEKVYFHTPHVDMTLGSRHQMLRKGQTGLYKQLGILSVWWASAVQRFKFKICKRGNQKYQFTYLERQAALSTSVCNVITTLYSNQLGMFIYSVYLLLISHLSLPTFLLSADFGRVTMETLMQKDLLALEESWVWERSCTGRAAHESKNVSNHVWNDADCSEPGWVVWPAD